METNVAELYRPRVLANQDFPTLTGHYIDVLRNQCSTLFMLRNHLVRPWYDRLWIRGDIRSLIKEVQEYQNLIDYAQARIKVAELPDGVRLEVKHWQDYRDKFLTNKRVKRACRL